MNTVRIPLLNSSTEPGGTGFQPVSYRAWGHGSLPFIEVWRHSLKGCATRTQRLCRGNARGFSLVEVLMAILILGIGLLGLGSVLPAVVKQQQASTESAMGSLAMNGARAALKVGRQGRNEVQRVVVGFNLDPTTGGVPTGLAFNLSFGTSGARTANILVQTTAATPQLLEEALVSLDALAGDQSGPDPAPPERTVRVSGRSVVDGTPARATITYDVSFIGRMGGADVPLLEGAAVGGGLTISTATEQVVGVPALDSTFWTELAHLDPAAYPDEALPRDASWMVPAVETSTGPGNDRGATLLGVNGLGETFFPADRRLTISLGERLQPSEASGPGADFANASAAAAPAPVPQYVWDIAVRRTGPFRTGTDRYGRNYSEGYQPPEFTRVQTAIFLRRVDGRLRAPADMSVFRALLARMGAPADRRWPVSVDTSGRPTNDGLVVSRTYSTPVAWSVEYLPTRVGPDGRATRDMLELTMSGTFDRLPVGTSSVQITTVFQAAARPGQLLVDNLGNVYTVIGPVPGFANTLRVSPPISPDVVATDLNAQDGAGTIRQIVFVPEGAVSVHVEVANP
ncbi:MAG: prepilin-type N-terminal cleavage/methylation domain-containing protein [Phycisphaerales bacterium]